MELFTGEIISGLVARSLHTASYEHGQWRKGEFVDGLTIKHQGESVVAGVERIRTHPLVPRHIPIHGYIDQVETGRRVEVPEATREG